MKRKSAIKIIMFSYLYFIFISLLSIKLEINYLLFVILYAGTPAVFFTLKLKSYIKKVLIESLFISFPAILIVNHIANISKAWYEHGILNIRILDTYPIDTFIWGFLYTYIAISGYVMIFDKNKKISFDENNKKLIMISIVSIILFFILIFITKNVFFIPYFYFMFISITIIYCIYLLLKYPILYKNISLMGSLSFIPSIIYEITALKLGHWEFSRGYHIGYIDLFGLVFPIEELFFFYVVIIAICVTYEVFADNRK